MLLTPSPIESPTSDISDHHVCFDMKKEATYPNDEKINSADLLARTIKNTQMIIAKNVQDAG
jgi:hypothetical protein